MMKKISWLLLLLVSVFFAESCISSLLNKDSEVEEEKEYEAFVTINGKKYSSWKNISFFGEDTDQVALYSPGEFHEHSFAAVNISHYYPIYFKFCLEAESDTDYFHTNTRYTDFQRFTLSVDKMSFDNALEGSWVRFTYPAKSSSEVSFYIEFEYVGLSADGSEPLFMNGYIAIYNNSLLQIDEERLHNIIIKN